MELTTPTSSQTSDPQTPPTSHLSNSAVEDSATQSHSIPDTTPEKLTTSAKLTPYHNNSELQPDLRNEIRDMNHPFKKEALISRLKSVKSDSEIAGYLRESKFYEKDWVKVPKRLSKGEREERLYNPLKKIFNEILETFSLSATRQVHLTYKKTLPNQDGDEVRSAPDFLVAGNGPQFRRQDCGKEWRSCVCFIDAKKEKDAPQNLKVDWEGQFAKYTRACFNHQPTRIFLYSIIITEQRFRLYRLSPPSMPVFHMQREVRPITTTTDGLSMEKEHETVTTAEDRLSTQGEKKLEDVKLTEVDLSWSSHSLIGRATTCWTVTDNVTGERHLLKQQYVNVERTPEHEILEAIKDIKGVVKVRFAQRIGEVMSKLREEIPGIVPTDHFHDRFLYRLVLEEYGKTIDNVTDFVLLLRALRDAIAGICPISTIALSSILIGFLAHREVYIKKHIQHRDISVRNILYAKDPKNLREGEGFGNLIDFELSVRLSRLVSCRDSDFRTGTRAFYSVRIHRRIRDNKPYVPHYMDDLQAFFWVFIWILASYAVDPNQRTVTKIKEPGIHELFQQDPKVAAGIKRAFLSECLTNVPDLSGLCENWDPILLELVHNLGSFFHNNVDVSPSADLVKEANEQAPEHYATILSHFDAAITRLDASPPIIIVPNTEARQQPPKEASIDRPKPKQTLSQGNTRLQTSSSLASHSSTGIPASVLESPESSPPRKKARLGQDHAA
ncbi:hypothetical protein CVT24_009877 [Panaeolus cyanescens]|uniref:Fungal-type protein kinase domain-containing protein n=1 Tax=Panaeolus cyanescens TaxID=181874 RepID=A0A409WU22_9AGAR|nr:hypothetical protein CVT24_009877 [Panaeolus cyanescens]